MEREEFFTTDVPNEPQNQEVTVRIRDYLKDNIAQKLKIATPTLYRDYEEYIGRFIKTGGIIEAKPPLENRCSLTYPSVSFCVEPNG